MNEILRRALARRRLGGVEVGAAAAVLSSLEKNQKPNSATLTLPPFLPLPFPNTTKKTRTTLGKMKPSPALLLLLAAAALFVLLLAPAAASAQDPPPPSSPQPPFRSPAEAVASRPDLSLLVAAVEATGLTPQFSSPDLPLTIFAPNNAGLLKAVESLGTTPQQVLAQNRSLLFDTLRFHVVPGAPVWSLERLRAEQPRLITLLPGAEPLEVRKQENGSVLIGGGLGPTAMIIDGDIYAGKSVIHVIDEVKIPGTLIDQLVPMTSPSPSPPGASSPPPPPAQRNGA
jgi:uncharacterized surface protein with fasciclin (FAS1) repeats